MAVTMTLRQDHALLHKKLAFLESALQVAPAARLVLREMCCSLLRLLGEHLQRERHLIERYAHDLPEHQRPPHATDHTVEHHLLRAVNELLLSGMRASVPMVVLRLSQAIDQLEARMEEQERTIFPALDQAAAWHPEGEPAVISGAMSVNEILQRYPQTGPIFDELHINRWREGYESVDELAWRHGMEAAQVLEQLRQVAASLQY